MNQTPKTREELQARLDARVAELRANAAKLQAESDAICAATRVDFTEASQPNIQSSRGRAFSAARTKRLARHDSGLLMAEEARQMLDKAGAMERRGVVMAGDAKARADKASAALSLKAGEMAHTLRYGPRRVIKVNPKSIVVESDFGPVSVPKHLVRAA